MSATVVPEFDNHPEQRQDDRADVPVSEITERFLRALLAKVPLDRIEEVYLFSPLRQGAVETGIAVVAARETEGAEGAEEAERATPAEEPLRAQGPEAAEGAERAEEPQTVLTLDDSPYAEDVPVAPAAGPVARVRHTVYTARYRLVVKGPERGRWEMDVVDEADAPLLAIESVVRGVQRRAGADTSTIRYDAQQLARALRMPWPSSP